MKRYINLRLILIVALFPLVAGGLFVLVVGGMGRVRYDSAYFAAPYTGRYETPGATARALERALQAGDQDLLAELEALRHPVTFEANPDVIFVMLWERDERYITYFYVDVQTHERYMYYFEQVNGRWVVSPPDAYYYLHSGRWLIVFTPLAIVWWLLGTVAILVVLVFRLAARVRTQMYDG